MREISTAQITQAVSELCIEANMHLPCDVQNLIHDAKDSEQSELGKSVISDLEKNLECSNRLQVPICQDTGMAVVFIKLGQDVHLVGGSLTDAVNEGVRQGYTKGHLRMSIVSDPLERINSNDNTPCVLHTEIVDGDKIEITVAPKGFGSENMSAIKMFTPSATEQDIIDFVADTVANAGSNPCPPIIVGVGIGGDFEFCAYLSKKALCRDTSKRNSDARYADLEKAMLDKINALGIGPQGFGGTTTALAVNIEKYATHIAGLPVAVNIGCHVTRHKTKVI